MVPASAFADQEHSGKGVSLSDSDESNSVASIESSQEAQIQDISENALVSKDASYDLASTMNLTIGKEEHEWIDSDLYGNSWGRYYFDVPSRQDITVSFNLGFPCSHGSFLIGIDDADDNSVYVDAFRGKSNTESMSYKEAVIHRTLDPGRYEISVFYIQSYHSKYSFESSGSLYVRVDLPNTKPAFDFRFKKRSAKSTWSGTGGNSWQYWTTAKQTWSSSNTKVAYFKNKNVKTITYNGIGETVITISQTECYDYRASSASYKLTIVPDKPTVKSVDPVKKGFKITWKKKSSKFASGYEVRYSLKSSMKKAKTKIVKGAGKNAKTIKSLKRNKRYYAQVRIYKKVSGKTYYSGWSKKKSVRTL